MDCNKTKSSWKGKIRKKKTSMTIPARNEKAIGALLIPISQSATLQLESSLTATALKLRRQDLFSRLIFRV